MPPIFPPENLRIQWSLRLALLLSLIVHGMILVLPTQSPRVEEPALSPGPFLQSTGNPQLEDELAGVGVRDGSADTS